MDAAASVLNTSIFHNHGVKVAFTHSSSNVGQEAGRQRYKVQWILLQASTVVGGGTSSEWALVVAVPGLTVPWSHAIYLWIATAISFGMHEVSTGLLIIQTCSIQCRDNLKNAEASLDCRH